MVEMKHFIGPKQRKHNFSIYDQLVLVKSFVT